LIPASAVIVHDSSSLSVEELAEMAEDIGYGFDLVSSIPVDTGEENMSIDTQSVGKLYSVSLSITGMHCASCVSSISKAIENVDGVVNGSTKVDLIGASATAQVVRKDVVDELVKEIEEVGFDCEVIKVRNEEKRRKNKAKEEERKVKVHVKGMFCE
jgi:Cu+-exporting ATPase